MSKKTKEVSKTLTIDERFWTATNHPEWPSKLLDRHGRMCCLGFLGEHCGVAHGYLAGRSMPFGGDDPQWPGWLFGEIPNALHSLLANPRNVPQYTAKMCAQINDEEKMEVSEKKDRLRKVFAHYDWKIRFTHQVKP